MTGICVSIMPAFMAECAPACLRGMVSTQLQMQIVVAQLVASAINFGTSTIKSDKGWMISIGKAFPRLFCIPIANLRDRSAVCHAVPSASIIPVHSRVSAMVNTESMHVCESTIKANNALGFCLVIELKMQQSPYGDSARKMSQTSQSKKKSVSFVMNMPTLARAHGRRYSLEPIRSVSNIQGRHSS